MPNEHLKRSRLSCFKLHRLHQSINQCRKRKIRLSGANQKVSNPCSIETKCGPISLSNRSFNSVQVFIANFGIFLIDSEDDIICLEELGIESLVF